jgi:hypothetical protein
MAHAKSAFSRWPEPLVPPPKHARGKRFPQPADNTHWLPEDFAENHLPSARFAA